jgi:catechol-2,3-dioxygenase
VQVQSLGHVVLKIRDLHRAEAFYSGTLGMTVVLRIDDPPMTFFSLDTPGNHHDFALMEIDAGSSTPADDATGLAHVAFKIGNSAEELRLARSVLERERTPVLYEAERRFTRSLHVIDPDGNEIELYVTSQTPDPFAPFSGSAAVDTEPADRDSEDSGLLVPMASVRRRRTRRSRRARSSGLLPHGNVLAALARKDLATPVSPALPQRHAG